MNNGVLVRFLSIFQPIGMLTKLAHKAKIYSGISSSFDVKDGYLKVNSHTIEDTKFGRTKTHTESRRAFRVQSKFGVRFELKFDEFIGYYPPGVSEVSVAKTGDDTAPVLFLQYSAIFSRYRSHTSI